jgi:hypothetical protein
MTIRKGLPGKNTERVCGFVRVGGRVINVLASSDCHARKLYMSGLD